MSRYFMIQSWVGSHENEPDYNGQQCGERNVRSSEVVPLYDQYGNANVSAFSDEAVAERTGKAKKTPKVSIQDKILPQAKRVQTLTTQMQELCQAYKAGEMDIKEYSMLMDVLVVKRDRAQVLLAKAMNTKPKRESQDETRLFYGKTVAKNCVSDEDDVPHSLDNISSKMCKKALIQRFIGATVLLTTLVMIFH